MNKFIPNFFLKNVLNLSNQKNNLNKNIWKKVYKTSFTTENKHINKINDKEKKSDDIKKKGSDKIEKYSEQNKNDDHVHKKEVHVKGLYHHIDEHHGDMRAHLNEDGTRKHTYDFDEYHWESYWTNVPKQNIVIVNGQKMIKGDETKPLEYLFNVSQEYLPFWGRSRLNIWGNHNMILKIEFLFFWIPTLIILSIAIPCYTMLYMLDEIVNTTMTVKVIGRQWYWIYEVESPPEDEDEEEEEEEE